MIVVVGNGMAGSRLVWELRNRGGPPITVFGAEESQPYNRVMLSNVLAGRSAPGDIGLTDPGWYAANDVDVRLGVPVTGIDRAARTVTSADGAVTPYDALVLATGSAPVVPGLPGMDAEGVVVFRTLEDCRAILRHAEGARSAVVVGGGLLGLEAARGLAGRGLTVTVVHRPAHLMDRQLDTEAGDVLRRTLGGLGVGTVLGARVAAVREKEAHVSERSEGTSKHSTFGHAAGEGGRVSERSEGTSKHSTFGHAADEGGRVTGVELDDGEILAADLVVLACGIRPETTLAVDAGLPVDRGVLVDDHLRSVADPRVSAIGECAQHEGMVYGLVAPAWEQARVVADVLTGGDATYTGSRLVTRLKAADIDLAAMGETDLGDDEAEVVRFTDPTRGTYKKVVIRDGRLVGAILLGETGTAGFLTQLYDRADPLPADRLHLLFPGLPAAATAADTPVRIPDTATVCQCNNVTKGRIRASWEAGARAVTDIAADTRATTGCGGCRDTVEGILEWLQAQA
jgi:assimilatory nitrate reductase electron transfer subunit